MILQFVFDTYHSLLINALIFKIIITDVDI